MYIMRTALSRLLSMCAEGSWVSHPALLCDEKGQVGEVVASWLAAQETLHCLVRNAVHIEGERPHSGAHLSPPV